MVDFAHAARVSEDVAVLVAHDGIVAPARLPQLILHVEVLVRPAVCAVTGRLVMCQSSLSTGRIGMVNARGG